MVLKEIAAKVDGKGLKTKQVFEILKQGLEVILSTVKSGERVTVLPLGVFKLKVRPSRISRNPKTGKPVKVPERKVVQFKESQSVKKRK